MRNAGHILLALEDAISESDRIEAKIASLRRELILQISSDEILAVLHSQPIGLFLRNGQDATPEEILEDEMSSTVVSVPDTLQPREDYRKALDELGIRPQNVALKVYGAATASKKLAQLRASRTLRALSGTAGIGHALKIDETGYVTMS